MKCRNCDNFENEWVTSDDLGDEWRGGQAGIQKDETLFGAFHEKK